MRRPAQPVLDKARLREVVAVFRSLDAVERAGDALLEAGFDRADIDVIAPPDEVRRTLGKLAYAPPEELASLPDTPRQPFVTEDDAMNTKIVFAATAGALVAMLTAFAVFVSGASPLRTAGWALFLGLAAAGGGFLIGQQVSGQAKLKGLGRLVEQRGIVMWVRVRSDEHAAHAREMLLAHGGTAVHVHEIELVKTPEDLPLADLRPDPWLGSERLGQP
jgi:hypothetical protein